MHSTAVGARHDSKEPMPKVYTPFGRKEAMAAFNSAQGIGNRSASCLILFAQLEPREIASSAGPALQAAPTVYLLENRSAFAWFLNDPTKHGRDADPRFGFASCERLAHLFSRLLESGSRAWPLMPDE